MPEAVIALQNAQQKLSVRNYVLQSAAIVFLFLGLAALPFFTNDYIQFILNTIVVYSLVSAGFNIVVGYLGQLAFANAGFFGIGAYVTGLLMVHLDLPFALSLILASIAGAAAGGLVGLIALRLSGYYLVVATFAFIEFLRWLYVHGSPLTFGASGFNIPDASIATVVLDTEFKKYFVLLAIAILAILATSRFLHSHFGRAIVAIRNNERAAAAAGVPVMRMKITAFAWSGFIVSIAGALYAILDGRVLPDSFGLEEMLVHFTMVVVGGLGSITGSILGAVLLTSLPEVLRNFPGVEEIVYSSALILVISFMPTGLSGLISDRFPILRERLYGATGDA